MGERYSARGWPFAPVPSGARISREERIRREAALAEAPLFSNLSKRQLRSLAEVTGVRGYDEGAEIVKEGSGGFSFFVILDGKAKVVKGGRTVARLSRGEFFGEISVLDGGPRTASVVAEQPLRCLTLARDDLVDVLKRDGLLATRILQEVASRLRRTERSPVS
jgi:CRP/FNR family cyclic AMP-dependent transcriptional regulator